ncbi:MAG: DUF1294 domain-containing protein [Bacteroidales bacterium]|nr:DUF1294 domain-containing protein [Bacteroidales bacterium]
MDASLLYYIIVISIVTFCAYGIDKYKAKKQQWRIPERTLILLAVFGGSIGALAAMRMFRHKTLHNKFRLGIPCILILQVACLYYFYQQGLFLQ